MPLRPWPRPRRRGRRCARPPLAQRRYRLVWHWRDDGPATLHRVILTAPTVDDATALLRRQLSHSFEQAEPELAVIEAALVDSPAA